MAMIHCYGLKAKQQEQQRCERIWQNLKLQNRRRTDCYTVLAPAPLLRIFKVFNLSNSRFIFKKNCELSFFSSIFFSIPIPSLSGTNHCLLQRKHWRHLLPLLEENIEFSFLNSFQFWRCLELEKVHLFSKGPSHFSFGWRSVTWTEEDQVWYMNVGATKNGRISNSPNLAGVSSIKFIVVNLKAKFTQHRLSKYEQELGDWIRQMQK